MLTPVSVQRNRCKVIMNCHDGGPNSGPPFFHKQFAPVLAPRLDQAGTCITIELVDTPSMAASGTKQTCPARHIMSVLGGKADIKDAVSDFR